MLAGEQPCLVSSGFQERLMRFSKAPERAVIELRKTS
jgi:hypothetical protein